jgi:hypothetical protein
MSRRIHNPTMETARNYPSMNNNNGAEQRFFLGANFRLFFGPENMISTNTKDPFFWGEKNGP